ncbi:VWA domain-containing protein, partial [Clostridium sp.]|uniref:vWA domain-containing protein n=1 Tax=Clostridium sp. TaxID=1506 RepID=UPI003D6CD504
LIFFVFVITYIISFLGGFFYLLMLLNVDISKVYLYFTCAKFEEVIKAAIDKIDSYGGTSVYSGIEKALDQFDAQPSKAIKNMIVLTDGEDNDNNDYEPLLKRAKDNNIVIYTIGLGTSIDVSLLNNIANTTGGKYYSASIASDLIEEFDKITNETIDYITDSDGDFLCNYYENMINEEKIRLGTGAPLAGKLLYLDESGKDTDGDTLNDGEELSIEKQGDKVYVYITSDPTLKDTDQDGITDDNEKAENKDALKWDISDRDLAIAADMAYHDLPEVSNFDYFNDSWKEAINTRLGDKANLNELVGWSIEDSHYSLGGLECIAFKKDNNLIIAYRGSEGNNAWDYIADWGVADILGFITGFNAQVPASKAFIKKVINNNRDCNIYVTGHSLGGNLAMNAASTAINMNKDKFERLATFNGLGLLVGVTFGLFDVVDEHRLLSVEDRIYDYRVEKDPVSNLWITFHYGEKKEVKKSDGAKDAHHMYSFFEQLYPKRWVIE